MAGAAQFYTPLLWPVVHLLKIRSIEPEKETAPKPKAEPMLDLQGHLFSFVAATRAFLMAYCCIYFFYNNSDQPYPAFRSHLSFFEDPLWMFGILIRNIIGTLLICGFWDYILYFNSYTKSKIASHKFNASYPSMDQFKHDAFYTCVASISAGLIEICLCYAWANGLVSYQANMFENFTTSVLNILWIIGITHWRSPHFYLIHRMMHPWKFNFLESLGLPDFGRILYKRVHSLHHKSYNPTTFSGTSMHPIESTLYYSSCLISVAFGCHPTIPLACMIDCAVGAWLGHDGFQLPGSGDYYHQLHHTHFDCNYGTTLIPIDYWVNTFISEKADLKKVWKKKVDTVGIKANQSVCQGHKEAKEM